MIGWRRSMDILLAPYQRSVPTVNWMSPLKVFEYMAAGRAIVASDLPVLHEVLTNGRNALLVSPEDESAWIRALLSLSDEVSRHRLARQARRDVEAGYTWNLRVQNVLPAPVGTITRAA